MDSFKWTILKNQLVGNTLYFINKDIDLETVMHHSVSKCYLTDNLKKFAKIHYKNKTNLLINFEKYLMRSKIMKLKKNNQQYECLQKLK